MLDSESQLHAYISHYMDDPEVKRSIDLIDINNERLFTRQEPPDFELQYPASLTKDVFLKILKKVFACTRQWIYKEIRKIVRERD